MNPDLFSLPTKFGPEMMVLGGAVLSVVCFFLLLWFSLIERDPLSSRIKSISQHKDRLRQNRPQMGVERRQNTVLQRKSFLTDMASRLRKVRRDQADKIRDNLAQAGWRSSTAMGVYVVAKSATPIVLVAIAAVFLFVVPGVKEWPGFLRFVLFIGAPLLGLVLPDMIVEQVAKGRRKKLEKGLPDALDLLVICTEAGLGLGASFDRVARELGVSHMELTDELTLTSVELNVLPDRAEALHNLHRRTNLKSIEAVVSTLMQTEQYGTPLAQSFRVLAADFRGQRLMRAEEKAARLPAIMTVPMIVFILPCLFVVLLGPAILQAMDAFKG
ncbi:MAG: type II secretion system F family protein [Alphaproteobacteria bacterium]|nr:type II secretion system F family protein [Alphaproteobacteria bacterium]